MKTYQIQLSEKQIKKIIEGLEYIPVAKEALSEQGFDVDFNTNDPVDLIEMFKDVIGDEEYDLYSFVL